MRVAEEISKYKLDLVGVQEVRWDRGGIEPANEHIFFYRKGNENHELGIDFLLYVRESSGREAEHSPPASAKVQKIRIYTSTPPYAFMA
jgi:hypothetical protein